MNWKKYINPFLIVMWLAIIVPTINSEYKETGTFPIGKVIMPTIAFLLGSGVIQTKLADKNENEQKPHQVLKSEHKENVGESMPPIENKSLNTNLNTTVINNFNGNVIDSQFQQGNNNVMNSNKDDSEIETVKLLLIEVKKLTKNLPANYQQSELQADIETIESQMKSPKPKIEVIKEIFKSIRNILEGSIGSTLSTAYPNVHELFKKLLP